MTAKTNYVLIDYENVQVKSLALQKGEHFRVQVFLGPKNLKLLVKRGHVKVDGAKVLDSSPTSS